MAGRTPLVLLLAGPNGAGMQRLRFLARERRDFAFETTLAGQGHARWLRDLRSRGYRTHLIFLALPDAERAAGMPAVIADRSAWDMLKEHQP